MKPIRVLHVVTVMNRNGLENRTMDIYRNIDREKVQFDFLCHRLEKGAFDDEIQALGGKVYRIHPLKVTHFFRYLKELCTFFTEHSDYKIVHSHMNAFSTWVLFAAKKAGIPIRIAHSRIWGSEKTWKAIFKYISKLFINIPTTHKFGCSQKAGEWLFGKKGVAEPNYFRVITNSIDISKFTFDPEKRAAMREKLGLSDGQLAFVDVARLTLQKNHTFLIDVFEKIKLKKPDAKLFLIGEGDLKASLCEKISEKGLSDSVEFLGTLPNVGDYLCAMDAFIFTSLFEGFGTVTIEAQCAGLPIIASDSIPHETKITDLQEFESLKNGADVWADHVLSMIERLPRRDASQETKAAGFDIKDTYINLQNFYLSVSGE